MHIEQHPKTELPEFTANFVIDQLDQFFNQGPTLMLLSGGSVGKDVAPHIFTQLNSFKQAFPLTLGLVDERFGPVDHPNSNMLLLRQAGIESKDAWWKVLYPLTPSAKTLAAAVAYYETELGKAFSACQERIVVVLGIGPDAHIAGIKPQPTQKDFERIFTTSRLVVGYEWTDFIRLSVTPAAIERSLCVVYAVGEAKREVLTQMQTASPDLIFRYPAISLRYHPRAYLFTDQVSIPQTSKINSQKISNSQ